MDKRIEQLAKEIGQEDLYRQDLKHCPYCGNDDCFTNRVGNIETDYNYMYEYGESVCSFCGLIRPYISYWRLDEGDWDMANFDKWRFEK